MALPCFLPTRPTNPGASTVRLVTVILAATVFAASPHAASPQVANESGIVGRVLRGPVEPGPTIAGAADEAPFRAIFHVLDSGREVARFESDEQGRFRVVLPPGKYTIVPDKSAPMLFPHQQTKNVTVPAGGYGEVTLRFDTGMR